MNHPRRSGLIAMLGFVLVATFALVLGVGIQFKADQQTINGFLLSHWGPVFLFAMPLSAVLMSYYFRAIDKALLSLDRIVKPGKPTTPPFSLALAEKLRYAWPTWIYPASLALSAALTLIADGRDIIAPLQSAVIHPSNEKDWSTLGFKSANAGDPLFYFAFNLSAFALQVFVAYCGFVLLLLTFYLLSLAIAHGLAEKELRALFSVDTSAQSLEYKINWDYKGNKGRCGLDMLDTVYDLYVALNFVCLGVSIVSVVVNERWKGGADLGSAILMFGNVIFIPVSFVWILLPYYSNFPTELPEKYKDKGYPKPTPWPWGSEKLTWGLIGLAISSWVYIASKAIAYLGL